MASDTDSTLLPPADRSSRRVGVAVLTIAYHPDVSRIGERCIVRGRELELSRSTPEFLPIAGGDARPLADRYLSRSPIAKLTLEGQVATLEASSNAPVIVDGQPIAGAAARAWQTYAPDRLAAGIAIELADRVVLVLHLADVRPPQAERHGLIGDSDAIERLRDSISRVGDLPWPVLIRGETGAGKELVARAVHAASTRSRQPFVGINVAALPASTAASELFGHARGAFTGAAQDHDGLFVRADGGTLFLDEIGETPYEVQPMLLRVLETSEVTPLGGARSRKVDVRVVAATDADLETQIAESGFREALFHRLAGYQVLVPSLRERRDDIGRLLIHFLRQELGATGDLARLEGQRDAARPWLPAAIAARIVRHDWPGNVRQLRNAARQLAISSRGNAEAMIDAVLERLLAATAPRAAPSAPSPSPAQRRDPATIKDRELVEALRAENWRAVGAAARLGVSRSTLYVLIEKSPSIRKAKDIPDAELSRVLAEHGGDVDAAAAALEVSSRALKLRISG